MASPQKENGYLVIATELFEAFIKFRFPGELRQVFDAVIRKTYGFNKKEDAIANYQIVEMTGLKRQNAHRAMKKLLEHKLVIKTDYLKNKGNVYKINKDYSQWMPFVIKTDYKKKVSSKLIRKSSRRITHVIRSDDKMSSELMDTKDNNHFKDNIQKTSIKIEQARWARDIIAAFIEINPAAKRLYRSRPQRLACVDLVETYTLGRVLFVIDKTLPITNKQAYFPTIITPKDLFTNWKRLEAAILKHKSKELKTGRGIA